MGNKNLYYKYKLEGRCTKCGDPLGDSPSTVRCSDCNEKFLEKQRTRPSNEAPKIVAKTSQLNAFKDNPMDPTHATVCVACGSPINTFGRLCQICLADRDFKLADAIERYGPKCCQCDSETLEFLMLVSANQNEAMETHGPALFKKVIHEPKLPKGYRVICWTCWRTLAIETVKNKRKIFERNNVQKQVPSDYSDDSQEEEIEVEDES